MTTASSARRPSAFAVPGRRGACLAVRTSPAAVLVVSSPPNSGTARKSTAGAGKTDKSLPPHRAAAPPGDRKKGDPLPEHGGQAPILLAKRNLAMRRTEKWRRHRGRSQFGLLVRAQA